MRTVLVLAIAFGLASCSKSEPPSPHVTTTARALIDGRAIVIDVREPDEFAAGHLATAVNVPVGSLSSRIAEVDAMAGGDRGRPIVVYCASGRRSAKAKVALEAEGFTQVVNGGGFDDLR